MKAWTFTVPAGAVAVMVAAGYQTSGAYVPSMIVASAAPISASPASLNTIFSTTQLPLGAPGPTMGSPLQWRAFELIAHCEPTPAGNSWNIPETPHGPENGPNIETRPLPLLGTNCGGRAGWA